MRARDDKISGLIMSATLLFPYFNTNYYILHAFFYTEMDTSIQAYGMITKGKEKLTTRTERSIQVNGICILRDTDQELYTLQMEKDSKKASGKKMSIKARSNTKVVNNCASVMFYYIDYFICLLIGMSISSLWFLII